MEIFKIDTILLNIVKRYDLECIYNLLVTNKYLNEKICKYYKNQELILNYMPLFKPCDNINLFKTL